MSQAFDVSCFQIRIGYQALRGQKLPGNLPFTTAANGLVKDFGHERVKAVLTAVPNNPTISEEAALAAAKAAC